MTRPDALTALRTAARGFFDPAAPVASAAAHGCLDVLGALEAEGGGTLAQMVLPGQVAVGLQPQAAGPPALRVRSAQIAPPVGDTEVAIPLADLLPLDHSAAAARIGEFVRRGGGATWAAGLLALVWLLHHEAPLRPRPDKGESDGLTLFVHGDLPQGAGQASSTALLAAAARALTDARGIPASADTLAQWAAAAEALAGGSPAPPARGHVIDACTCLYPRRPAPTLLRYSARPHRLVGPVPLPADARVFALDTGVRYHHTRDTLEELRVAGAMGLRIIETIYRDLGQRHTPLHGYLTNTSPLLYRQYFRALLPRRLRGSDFVRTYGPLPEELLPAASDEIDTPRLYRVRTAVDHVIAENEHAEQFLQAMEELADAPAGGPAGDDAERQRTLQRAGRLLLASHHSYRLRLELSCREADWLVDALMEAGPDRGVYGARITGCGGGGTVVALLGRTPAATDALLSTIKAYHRLTGLTLGVVEV
jgi:L-arabinokinase